MARVIYGVSGEGSGHSSRASEIARHLIDRGHEVRIATYGRGLKNLGDCFDCIPIEGLSIVSHDNEVHKLETLFENLRRMPEGSRRFMHLRNAGFRQFAPHVAITDFEPMTAYLAELEDVPLISVDNQHRMRYVHYDPPPGTGTGRELTLAIIRAIVPRPGAALVTAFVQGEPTNDHTWIFPPLVRRTVRDATPEDGDWVLVYLTSGCESLLEVLKQFPRERFRVYGYDRNERDANLQFLPASKEGFVRDLGGARGVIATAGFTLISESLYLGKPYLALPMDGQFEQQLNAWQLAESGLGCASTKASAESVGNFLYRLPDLRERLRDAPRDDGSQLKAKLDEVLAGMAGG